MNIEIYDAILKLDQQSQLKLNDTKKGGCVHVHWGRVWITRQGDRTDHIISDGESLDISDSAGVVVTAMNAAGVSVMERCAGQKPAGRLLDRRTPSVAEIDRHVEYAHQLRARAFADAFKRGWAATRRAVGAQNTAS